MPDGINISAPRSGCELDLPQDVVATSVTLAFWKFFNRVATVDYGATGMLRLAVATGPTAIGKSFAARGWARHHGAVYVSLAGDAQVKGNSLLAQTQAVLRAMSRVRDDAIDFARLYPTVRDALVPAGPAAELKRRRTLLRGRRLMHDDPDETAPAPMTLIIDEAQRLTFCGIAVASDLAEAGATVILIGTDDLRAQLSLEPRSPRQRSLWQSVASRFAFHVYIDGAHLSIDDDREALAHASGITDRAAIDYLRRLKTTDGALRQVAWLIVRARHAAGGAPVTLRHLEAEAMVWGMKAPR